jgi:nucleotide-binding universal stress UspA family protein
MLKKILVPVIENLPLEPQMGHAAALSDRFEAYIEFAHCRPAPEDFLPHGLPVPDFLRKRLLAQAEDYADYQEDDMKRRHEQRFNEIVEKLGGGPGVVERSGWREFQGRPNHTIRERGRLADLILVAKPSRDIAVGTTPLLTAIFDTGRPVLMCPEKAGDLQALGRKVCIAWNGSLHAARAVGMTLDILQQAEEVTVLTARSEEAHGASAEDLEAYLALRGIEARFDRFEPDGRIGDALMKRQEALGASLMIMGAYSVSHEREAIFGGNTQRIVDKTKLPVIFVH